MKINRQSKKFLIKFFAIFAFLQILIILIDITFIQKLIAETISQATNLTVLNITIMSEIGHFIVTPNCTGLIAISILTALIFSLNKPDIKEKILIFLAGAIVLFMINLARIYIVIQTGLIFGFNYAELAHIISWFLMSAVLLIIWIKLTQKIAKVKELNQLL